jgi:hypothetical protein
VLAKEDGANALAFGPMAQWYVAIPSLLPPRALIDLLEAIPQSAVVAPLAHRQGEPGASQVPSVECELGRLPNGVVGVEVGRRRQRRNLAAPFVVLKRHYRVVYSTIDDYRGTRG